MTHVMSTFFLFGLPRSGTTWVAKILDSHPDLLYLHEPDIAIRNHALSSLLLDPLTVDEEIIAEDYISLLENCRHPRALAIRPLFKKNFRSMPHEWIFRSVTQSSNLFFHYSQLFGWPSNFNIPFSLIGGAARKPKKLIKSVSCFGRMMMYASLRPHWQFLHVIRHPCAFIASKLQAARAGIMELDVPASALSTISQHLGIDLTPKDILRLPDSEQLALHWVIMNDLAWRTLSKPTDYRQISFERLLVAPHEQASTLFAELELDVPTALAGFLGPRTSTRKTGFYSLKRNAIQIHSSWRASIEARETDRIRALIERYPFGQRYNATAEHWQ